MRIKTITLLLIMCTSLISCKNTTQKYSSLPFQLLRDVASSGGFSNKTDKLVLQSTVNGKQIIPCGDINIEPPKEDYNIKMKEKEPTDQTKEAKQKNQGCLTKIVDPSNELRNAIDSTSSILKGTIMKNGKRVEAKFFVRVTALYEGSHCANDYTIGDQYEECITLRQTCLEADTYPDLFRNQFNQICKHFSFW